MNCGTVSHPLSYPTRYQRDNILQTELEFFEEASRAFSDDMDVHPPYLAGNGVEAREAERPVREVELPSQQQRERQDRRRARGARGAAAGQQQHHEEFMQLGRSFLDLFGKFVDKM